MKEQEIIDSRMAEIKLKMLELVEYIHTLRDDEEPCFLFNGVEYIQEAKIALDCAAVWLMNRGEYKRLRAINRDKLGLN